MSVQSQRESREYATEKLKLIIMGMNGLSEQGFANKYNNDPSFHTGFDVLVRLLSGD